VVAEVVAEVVDPGAEDSGDIRNKLHHLP